jgi:hypothetical protein
MSTLLSSVMGTTPMLNNAISLPAQVPLGLVCVCVRVLTGMLVTDLCFLLWPSTTLIQFRTSAVDLPQAY